MKKFPISYLLVAPALILMSCGESNSASKTNTPHQKESKMTRQKNNSGLEFEILKEGTGISPKKGQSVTVHYTGWLLDASKPEGKGAKFDSSKDRNQPFTFTIGIGHVIQGWDEGVLSMKMGEQRRLIIPASLGYGARGAGRSIPPHATLVFDVELLNIG